MRQMRQFKHLTPIYMMDKIKLLIYASFHKNDPWLTRQSIEFLDSSLRRIDFGIEFGSGRSTIWLGKRVGHLISIEHDEHWFKRVQVNIKENNLHEKIELRLAGDKISYISIIDQMEKDSVDFCLIDGEYRDDVANRVLEKMKMNSILVIDNINWYIPNDYSRSPNTRRTKDGYKNESWETFHKSVQNWRYFWTSNGITDTGIWIK